MKFIASIACILFADFLFAQDDLGWKEASKESQAYHASRIKPTVPSYGLAKIKALIAKIKSTEDDDMILDQKTYLALPLREKFTYHMIHGESYSQNCDAMPPIQDEQKKISAYVPEAFDEYAWSEKQKKFLVANRDSVMAIMSEIITRTKRAGVNFKQAIIEINGKEMIPLLISTYKINKKDLDLLTVLMQLMKDNEYAPFLESASYKKLYGDDASYSSYLNFNKSNEALILQRATDFYNGVKK